MNSSPKKQAIALSILFAVVYMIHGISGPAYYMFQSMQTETEAAIRFLGGYHIITLAMAALFYLPLSICIRRLAKQAQLRILKLLATFFIVVFSWFVVLNAILIIVWLFNPSLFG